jgi:UDP-N-acetylglucosamine 2-epimerase (non-hydrolysing)
VDSAETLKPVLDGLSRINKVSRVVLPIHPRTRKNAERFGLGSLLNEFLTLHSLGYLEMLSLVDGAAVVLTDSGGLQEETTVLGVPCVTLREQTERPITLTEGTNQMAPWPLTAAGIFRSFESALLKGRAFVGARCPQGWDGSASNRIVAALSSGLNR